jgi:hypothetical protein
MTWQTEALRLVDAGTLRAVWLALRGDVETFEPPDSVEPALVEPVAEPFDSVDGAVERLAELETRLRARDDRRAVFLTIYERMTRAVRNGIEGGRFADADWMRDYTTTFANYYRRAFLAFERGHLRAVPDPWRVAFGTAGRADRLVVQDAFLGVNAHINYDLALALRDVGIDSHRERKYADHLAIDDILARLIDAQQTALADLYAPAVEDIDGALGRFDESLTLYSLTEGRQQAWRMAVVLSDAPWSPVRTLARRTLRTTATGAAFLVRGPGLDPEVVARLRAAERDGLDLETVLARLETDLDAAIE